MDLSDPFGPLLSGGLGFSVPKQAWGVVTGDLGQPLRSPSGPPPPGVSGRRGLAAAVAAARFVDGRPPVGRPSDPGTAMSENSPVRPFMLAPSEAGEAPPCRRGVVVPEVVLDGGACISSAMGPESQGPHVSSGNGAGAVFQDASTTLAGDDGVLRQVSSSTAPTLAPWSRSVLGGSSDDSSSDVGPPSSQHAGVNGDSVLAPGSSPGLCSAGKPRSSCRSGVTLYGGRVEYFSSLIDTTPSQHMQMDEIVDRARPGGARVLGRRPRPAPDFRQTEAWQRAYALRQRSLRGPERPQAGARRRGRAPRSTAHSSAPSPQAISVRAAEEPAPQAARQPTRAPALGDGGRSTPPPSPAGRQGLGSHLRRHAHSAYDALLAMELGPAGGGVRAGDRPPPCRRSNLELETITAGPSGRESAHHVLCLEECGAMYSRDCPCMGVDPHSALLRYPSDDEAQGAAAYPRGPSPVGQDVAPTSLHGAAKSVRQECFAWPCAASQVQPQLEQEESARPLSSCRLPLWEMQRLLSESWHYQRQGRLGDLSSKEVAPGVPPLVFSDLIEVNDGQREPDSLGVSECVFLGRLVAPSNVPQDSILVSSQQCAPRSSEPPHAIGERTSWRAGPTDGVFSRKHLGHASVEADAHTDAQVNGPQANAPTLLHVQCGCHPVQGVHLVNRDISLLHTHMFQTLPAVASNTWAPESAPFCEDGDDEDIGTFPPWPHEM